MHFKPWWYNMLPDHLKPEEEKIDSLEKLRQQYELSHDTLAAGIEISNWAAIRALELTLERFRNLYPEKTEKELWEGVILSWFEGIITYVYQGNPPEHILEIMKSLDGTLKDINSWSDVTKFIMHLEIKEKDRDYSGIQDEIESLLERETRKGFKGQIE
ncbi:MAG: hypothetical protein WCD80_06210 [Desulfobaccales bacterium]